MLPRLLAFPCIVGIAVFLYLGYAVDTSYGKFIVPFIIGVWAAYIFEPQLNWWWYKRYPPDIDDQLKKMFEVKLPFYQKLSPENKSHFRQRTAMYMLANDFIPQGPETVPEDVKGFITANIIQLTFGQTDYRMPKFERMVVYPTPFLSPQYREYIHSSELFEEDGVLLFAIDHLMPGTMESTRYYNICLHEFARVFRLSYPEKKYPTFSESIWDDFAKLSGYTKVKIEKYIGLPDQDPWPVSVVLFFSFPAKFKKHLPELYQEISHLLNLDLLPGENPVLDESKVDRTLK